MQIKLGDKIFNVYVTRKNNKNMYLRVKADGIYISCNYFVTNGMIKSFILNNEKAIVEGDKRFQKMKMFFKMEKILLDIMLFY